MISLSGFVIVGSARSLKCWRGVVKVQTRSFPTKNNHLKVPARCFGTFSDSMVPRQRDTVYDEAVDSGAQNVVCEIEIGCRET